MGNMALKAEPVYTSTDVYFLGSVEEHRYG